MEKRAVGIAHEFLSLTMEKMVEVEKFSQSVQEVVWDRGQCPGRVLGSPRDILPLDERKATHDVFEGDV